MPIADILCPKCDGHLKCHKCVQMKESAAEPGDLTVCRYCGTVLVYRRNMTVRIATRMEMACLEESEPETFRSIMAAVTEIKHIIFVERSMMVN